MATDTSHICMYTHRTSHQPILSLTLILTLTLILILLLFLFLTILISVVSRLWFAPCILSSVFPLARGVIHVHNARRL